MRKFKKHSLANSSRNSSQAHPLEGHLNFKDIQGATLVDKEREKRLSTKRLPSIQPHEFKAIEDRPKKFMKDKVKLKELYKLKRKFGET